MGDIAVEMAASNSQPSGNQPSRSRYDLTYKPGRDSESDIRNTMLVVAALITAATFAAGINPPGGVWQEDNVSRKQYSGKSILGTQSVTAYRVFFLLNSTAFSSATLVINYLVWNFPYSPEIWGALGCMAATYGASVAAVSPPGDHFYGRFIWVAIAFPYMVRIIADLWNKYWGKG